MAAAKRLSRYCINLRRVQLCLLIASDQSGDFRANQPGVVGGKRRGTQWAESLVHWARWSGQWLHLLDHDDDDQTRHENDPLG